MFNISFSELLVICAVGVLFLNPKELKKMLRRMKKFSAMLSTSYNNMITPIRNEISDLNNEISNVNKYVRDEDGNLHVAYDVEEIHSIVKNKPQSKKRLPHVS